MASETESSAGIEDGVRRRDFINIAAVSFAGVGAVAVVLPLVNQMNPSADVLALSSTEIDISAIGEGQAIKTSWRKQPVFVRNLTAAEIAEANSVPMSDLREPQTLAERTKPGKENWLITLGVCTHLAAFRWAPPRVRIAAILVVISVRATVRTTTPRRASAKARRLPTWSCRPMSSPATPS